MEPVVLFGAGRLGERVEAECTLRRIPVAAVADNHTVGHLGSRRILRAEDLTDERYRDLKVVVTIFNGAGVRKQLRAMGLNVQSCGAFLLEHGIVLPDFGIASPEFYDRHLEDIEKLIQVVADQESRRVVTEQMFWRIRGMTGELPPPSPASEMYFPPFIRPLSGEVYFDCGAYDGDTIRQFKAWNQDYKLIVAFEPVRSVHTSPDVRIFRCAVGQEYRDTTFSDEGPGSHEGPGDVQSSVIPLDWLRELNPTYIKMDIEGAEYNAILGARVLLCSNTPVMAVCLYHRPEHLWTVPLLLHFLLPQYKIFIRRYADDSAELICYAVPESRLR